MSDTVLLDQKAAAGRLKTSVRTLERWRVMGEGPPYVKFTSGLRSSIRYREIDIEAWIASRVRTSTSDAA